MIPIQGLYEAHLNVADLDRSMSFYENVVGLELAQVFSERKVAFYWIGGRKSMLGLWQVGTSPQRLSLHIAFAVELQDLLKVPARLRGVGVEPRDFEGKPSLEPVVLAWMPAAAVYFYDPDGHLLEFLCLLPQAPRPELGVLPWNQWPGHEQLAAQ